MSINTRQFASGGNPTVFSFGTGNTFAGVATDRIAVGTGNDVDSDRCGAIGANNDIFSSSTDSFAVGNANFITTSPRTFVLGNGNNAYLGSNSLILGEGQTPSYADNCLFLGNGNDVTASISNKTTNSLMLGTSNSGSFMLTNSLFLGASNTGFQNPTNSLVLGNANSLTASGYRLNCVLLGDTNTSLANTTFGQGANNTLHGGEDVFVQGSSNTSYNVIGVNRGAQFIQGRSNYLNAQTRGFVQGVSNNVISGLNSQPLAIGFTNTINVSTLASPVAIGGNLSVTDQGFAWGYGYGGSGVSGYASVSMGSAVTVSGSYSFGQGGWYVDNQGNWSLVQGSAVYLTNASSQAVLIQGANINLSGNTRWTFAQGRDHTATNILNKVFMQGSDCGFPNASGGSQVFMQGYFLYAGSNYPTNAEHTFIHGYNNTVSASTASSCFLSGRDNDLGTTATSSTFFSQVFAHGSNLTVNNASGTTRNVFAQGESITVTAVSEAFAQGRTITVTGNRTFAQGVGCTVPRDDQKTWGSNRSGGLAQSSKIIKHIQTTSATQTTLITLDLEEDKTYSITVDVVVRNTTTNGENARFEGSFIAYRDTAGAAVLFGGTASLSGTPVGAGALDWDVDIAAVTNDILLRVTGDATDTLEWLADFSFREVAG